MSNLTATASRFSKIGYSDAPPQVAHLLMGHGRRPDAYPGGAELTAGNGPRGMNSDAWRALDNLLARYRMNEFLADLDAVCPKVGQRGFSTRFLEDLERTFAAAQESTFHQPIATEEDLAQLAQVLTHWRASYQQQLRGYLARLPNDDPMLLPVSLFGTMDYGRLETAHTRTLAWLLGDCEHGFGARLLEAFLRHVLDDAHLRVTEVNSVWAEYPCSSATHSTTGRIDVIADGRLIRDANDYPWLLAIEAKIHAEEGEEQLALYDDWLERRAGSKEIIRVFLTPNGRASETGETQWKPLSFLDLASVFRRVRDLQDKPGYHFLRYYLAGLLRDVCALPVPVSAECRNPYTAADYLKSVLGPAVEEGCQ